MKKSALSLALGLVALGAGAQEVGNVLSSTPVVQQVQVPRQVCGQPMVVQQQTSGGGGLLGALLGAGIGSQIGGGSGRTAGLLIGAAGGAIIGNQIEANNQQAMAQPQCTTQMAYENRTVGYNVTYEYGGRQYTVQMPYDPGPTIRLRVSPMVQDEAQQPLMPQAGMAPAPVVIAPPMQGGRVQAPVVIQEPQAAVQQQPQVIVQQPQQVVVPAGYPVYPVAYPAPVYRPYYPPVGISLNFGYSNWGGHRHHR